MYHKFIMSQSTAQMLNVTGYLEDNSELKNFGSECQKTWLAYYLMNALVINCTQMAIPTVNGLITVSNGADETLWTAIQRWRELRETTDSYINIQRQKGSEYLNIHQFINLWSRHLVLYQIHELYEAGDDDSVKSASWYDWHNSLNGIELPEVND